MGIIFINDIIILLVLTNTYADIRCQLLNVLPHRDGSYSYLRYDNHSLFQTIRMLDAHIQTLPTDHYYLAKELTLESGKPTLTTVSKFFT